ncbi:fumarylacetoacetate hydrolase family protein [Mesorhizobium australicum]|uniref:2-keto-4-pentenoate hydratase/2-oxohepta-3-ene-1,7-dioic acid hydratase (Catechol pathway) n=1 Tax=Mesorhizobium australicum TaxID=536018 RepID=A0A1X7P3D8_9HYPH|nr:fumarylacetoacetate hydrolase family protein [Mesorhizobium australicum]SMH45136.1 2-keto-4-pentenoate hydratase/2-oxohepta-3-ene-1,7-dioic acid hydratase (catechol pathway) [Mesorhizobium australicum]
MKLLRFGDLGLEKPGILDKDGVIRDASSVVADYSPATVSLDLLSILANIDPTTLPAAPKGVRIGSPVSRIGHFIAIGLNYADHAAETGAPIPKEPIVFSKAPSCLSGPNDDVMLPKGSVKSDWEVELAIVIGKECDYVEEKDALKHVFGYAVCNDVSEREYQAERGGQWIKGKSAPTFGPLGPWIVTPDEIADPQSLDMFLDVNGKRMQTGNTSTMIFTVRQIVSYLSQFMILEPGDVITTGTPPGVGLGMKPPVFLKDGDEMRLGIAGLGEQRQKVVAR